MSRQQLIVRYFEDFFSPMHVRKLVFGGFWTSSYLKMCSYKHVIQILEIFNNGVICAAGDVGYSAVADWYVIKNHGSSKFFQIVKIQKVLKLCKWLACHRIVELMCESKIITPRWSCVPGNRPSGIHVWMMVIRRRCMGFETADCLCMSAKGSPPRPKFQKQSLDVESRTNND